MKTSRLPARPLIPALLLLLGCSSPPSPASAPPPPSANTGPEGAMLSQRGTATVSTRDGRTLHVAVEIASNDRDRARGLMFRKSMPEMAGMVFVFPQEQVQSFWMKNTYLPLDLLFIDAKGLIVGIVEFAEPLTLTPRSVNRPSLYVLEVNGGWCARNRVGAGDRLALAGDYTLE